ncbi:hypothetical protein TNCV_2617661 [Trichonephila clavipes]|nr:hypothetical protein TNCV_2617661 [Trichonephila clavipes]
MKIQLLNLKQLTAKKCVLSCCLSYYTMRFAAVSPRRRKKSKVHYQRTLFKIPIDAVLTTFRPVVSKEVPTDPHESPMFFKGSREN